MLQTIAVFILFRFFNFLIESYCFHCQGPNENLNSFMCDIDRNITVFKRISEIEQMRTSLWANDNQLIHDLSEWYKQTRNHGLNKLVLAPGSKKGC